MQHPAIIRVTVTDGTVFVYGPYEKAEAEELAEALEANPPFDLDAEAESLVTLDDAGLDPRVGYDIPGLEQADA
jgi:hypothetical protein